MALWTADSLTASGKREMPRLLRFTAAGNNYNLYAHLYIYKLAFFSFKHAYIYINLAMFVFIKSKT